MLNFLIGVALFWIVVGFFDLIFSSCLFFPYLNFLGVHNIRIKPGRIYWHTTAFNRTFYRLGALWPRLLRFWLNLGTLVSCIAIFGSLWVLFSSAWNFISHKNEDFQSSSVLKPVLPGVNLPLSDLWYFLASIPLCSIIHELGHAIAAAREKLKIQGCGILLFGIFPGAFVELLTHQVVTLLTPWQQLRVFCAGVWNNIVLALLVAGILYSSPLAFSLFYSHPQDALTVVKLSKDSGISGPAGLVVGDRVTALNGCRVSDLSSWELCLWEAFSTPLAGYCAPNLQIRQHELSENCCEKESASGLCFQISKQDEEKRLACLPARKILQLSSRLCLEASDCAPMADSCLIPFLPGDNVTRLTQISRMEKDSVLFLGNPLELLSAVRMSHWYPRLSWLPVWLPYSVELFLKFTVVISSGLALLNVVPCVALDGQWIVQALVELFLPPLLPKSQHRHLVTQSAIVVGTFLLGLNIYFGLQSLF